MGLQRWRGLAVVRLSETSCGLLWTDRDQLDSQCLRWAPASTRPDIADLRTLGPTGEDPLTAVMPAEHG